MSNTTNRPRVDNPFAGGMEFEQTAQREMVPVAAGAATDRATAAIVTAQRVAIKRNVPSILAEAKALATAAGDKFYYSIPFKDRSRDGGERTVLVEGPSIGCAMAALNCYGNCAVEAFPANETQTHWTFMARFTDYEKGVTVTRSFNQRKGQNTGMRDRGRSEDIAFQIGQSKAIRNVVVAGLKWLTDEMFGASKSGVLGRIGKNPDGAREWLVKRLEEQEVMVARVERVIGRVATRWTVNDMARIFAELQAIEDGFADAEDLYPTSQAAAEEIREDIEAAEAGKFAQKPLATVHTEEGAAGTATSGATGGDAAPSIPQETRPPRKPRQPAAQAEDTAKVAANSAAQDRAERSVPWTPPHDEANDPAEERDIAKEHPNYEPTRAGPPNPRSQEGLEFE